MLYNFQCHNDVLRMLLVNNYNSKKPGRHFYTRTATRTTRGNRRLKLKLWRVRSLASSLKSGLISSRSFPSFGTTFVYRTSLAYLP